MKAFKSMLARQRREELFTGLFRDIACSDGYVLDALLARRPRDVDCIFEEDDRVVVCVSDGVEAVGLRGANDGLRRSFGL